MNARKALIIFTAIWVISSIASGQSDTVTNALFETEAIRQPEGGTNLPSLYSQTSVDIAPEQPMIGDGDVLRPMAVTNYEVVLIGYTDNSTPEADDKAARVEPFLDLTAEQSASAELRPEPATNSELFVQLAIWTVIILCACVLVVLGIRYVQRRQGLLPETDHQSRVLQTLSLGAHRTVSLVQLGEVRAIVGCDSTGVSNIVPGSEFV